MGTVMVACRSQLSRTKKGKERGTANRFGAFGLVIGPSLVVSMGPGVCWFDATMNPLPRGGVVKLLNRVYLPIADSLGRNDAHAPSTRAAAPRKLSIDALADQLVCAARAPAWSAVRPPGCIWSSSLGTGVGVVSALPGSIVGGGGCAGAGAG